MANSINPTVLQLDLPGIRKIRSGKVREVFDLGDAFLLVASDRISAFDVIMPNGIPRKGEVLTQISHFWFEKFASLVPNHLLAKADDPLPKNLQPFAAQLALFINKERALEASRAAQVARQSEKLQKALFDSVSHELKTPLAAISAALHQPQLDRVDR